MGMTFEAVYENGALRPLEAVALHDHERVIVTISSIPPTCDNLADYFEPEVWEVARRGNISLDEVRLALSSIPGSLADAVIESREER